ncbi:transglutaminase domain-containing protein [Candidatus Dojkabacteria bacterium]|nr:transglutaminase domain-containing protein [Candidatus Dojkabacteria bacterium]
MKILKKIARIFSSVCFIFVLLPIQEADASGVFNITVDRTYEVDTSGHMQVTETRTIKNNTPNFYIQAGSFETFQILSFRIGAAEGPALLSKSVSTAKITDGSGRSLLFSHVSGKDKVDLKVEYPINLSSGQTMVFKLQYTNYELSEKIGALYDVYIHGFDESFKFITEDSVLKYNTTLIVPDSFGEENFVSPAPISKENKNGKILYKFSQESLVDQFVWLQLGKKQFYRFKIVQEVKATDQRDTGFYNEYRLVLPRDIDEAEIEQKVYYSSINPSPNYIETDKEGNLVGTFEFPTNFAGVISLDGYAEVSVAGSISESEAGNISDISGDLSDYLKPGKYWEVDDSEIRAKAIELKGSEENVYRIVEKTYSYIVNTIDYSDVKRFGLNKRQGAKKTLEGGAAVCMEYSDLFLTLTRAQGIPARAAFGYGYDSRVPSTEQESHQWVEVYMPGVNKWVSVEVTWGESGTTLIGGDMNHFYTHLAGEHPEKPNPVELTSFGSVKDLTSPEFEISVMESRPEGDYQEVEDLLREYPHKKTWVNLQDLTKRVATFGGKIINEIGVGNSFLILGSCMTLIIIACIVNAISKYMRAKKREI